MNIEDIKERVGLRAHMKTLCNNPNMLTNWVGSINYNNAEDDVIYLLSLIEQAEIALSYIAYSENVTAMNATAEEALQAIRKGD